MSYRKMFVAALFSALVVYGWSYLSVPNEALIAMCMFFCVVIAEYVRELEERIDRLERHMQRERADMR